MTRRRSTHRRPEPPSWAPYLVIAGLTASAWLASPLLWMGATK